MKTWFTTQVLPSLYLNDVFDNISSGFNSLGGRLTMVLLAVGAVLIVVGGYYYSSGEEGKRKGKHLWLQVAGGVGFALVAVAFISYIKSIMGNGGFGG